MERLDVLSVLAEGDGVAKVRKVSKAETETKAHAVRTRGLSMPVWEVGFFFMQGFRLRATMEFLICLIGKQQRNGRIRATLPRVFIGRRRFGPFIYVLRRIRRSVTRKVFFSV